MLVSPRVRTSLGADYPLFASSLISSLPHLVYHKAGPEYCITRDSLPFQMLVELANASYWQRSAWGRRARKGLLCWALL